MQPVCRRSKDEGIKGIRIALAIDTYIIPNAAGETHAGIQGVD
jgi:hypothetical protein